jgi:hypothetical protein
MHVVNNNKKNRIGESIENDKLCSIYFLLARQSVHFEFSHNNGFVYMFAPQNRRHATI